LERTSACSKAYKILPNPALMTKELPDEECSKSCSRELFSPLEVDPAFKSLNQDLDLLAPFIVF